MSETNVDVVEVETVEAPVVTPTKRQRMKKAIKAKGKKPKNGTGVVKMKGKTTPIKQRDPKILQSEIKELLKDLDDASDTDDKKRIRRALRARGYYISQEKVKVVKGKSKGKAKKAEPVIDEVEDVE